MSIVDFLLSNLLELFRDIMSAQYLKYDSYKLHIFSHM